jgi:hypothetical protein
MATHNTATLRSAQVDAYTTLVGAAGKLNIYDGTQPAAGGTATNLLAQFTCGSPFAPSSSAGVLSPNIPAATTGAIAGTATWYRLTTSAGVWIRDSVITELGLSTTAISVGLALTVNSWTITAPNA